MSCDEGGMWATVSHVKKRADGYAFLLLTNAGYTYISSLHEYRRSYREQLPRLEF